MSLNLWEALATNEEVTSNHAQVTVPPLQVMDNSVLLVSESESKRCVSHAFFIRNPEHLFSHQTLILKHSYDETLKN